MPVPAAPPPGATLQKPRTRRRRQAERGTDQPAAKACRAAEARAGARPRLSRRRGAPGSTTCCRSSRSSSTTRRAAASTRSSSTTRRTARTCRSATCKGYVPLRLMADPPPRSAREFMKVGESVTLVVESFAPARRSIDLAVPAMATRQACPPRGAGQADAEDASREGRWPTAAPGAEPTPAVEDAGPADARRRRGAEEGGRDEAACRARRAVQPASRGNAPARRRHRPAPPQPPPVPFRAARGCRRCRRHPPAQEAGRRRRLSPVTRHHRGPRTRQSDPQTPRPKSA